MSGDWWDDLADSIRLWTKIGVTAVVLVPILLAVIVALVIAR